MSYDDYQRFLQFQNYMATQQQISHQNSMMPAPQYYPMQQQASMVMPPQPPVQTQMVQQQQPETITVEPVSNRVQLKPGQANDLPVTESRSHLEGTKKSIKDVIDKNIVVKDIRTITSKFKHPTATTCNMYQFSYVESREQNIDELENHIFISGSKILADQSKRYISYLPFYARVTFVNNRYYSFETAKFDTDNK